MQLHFEVGDPIRVDYNDLINKSKTITNLRFQRDNVGVFVLVRHLESNELILLANTHLYWVNNTDTYSVYIPIENPAHADVKLAQISYFTDRIHQFITESNINPKIILGGDFNSIPGSDVVKFLKEGSVSYDQNKLEPAYCQRHGKMGAHNFVFARSRLYQRRFSRPRSHFSAFFELYIFSLAPLQISANFQHLCTVFRCRKFQKSEKMGAHATVKRRVGPGRCGRARLQLRSRL